MAREFTNHEVARLLRNIAAAYSVKEDDRFRIMAYERVAASVEHATSEIKDLWDDQRLGDLAGVGPNIASHLDELFRTGKVRHFEEVMKGLPPAMFEFLSIPGIGPKTAFKLCRKLKIVNPKKAISILEVKAKAGKIREIEGFGEESEKDILEGIRTLKAGETKETRMLLPYADMLAHEIISYLLANPAVTRADALGSLRRMVSTIGDIDIAVETTSPREVIEWFVKYPKVKRVLEKGEEALARVVLENGRQVDLRLQAPDSYGAMLQYFTGGKAHNISLREWAQKKGMSLSEYGIKIKGKLEKFASEEEFYRKLGMEWIPPELREDTGEIEAALLSRGESQGKSQGLPELVKLEDIRGDLHVHSNFPIEASHDEGVNSMEEIMNRALEQGLQYVGFSEHNPSTSKHNPEQVLEILKHKKEACEQLNYSYEKRGKNLFIHAYNGLEIDMKPNGELGIPEKGLDYLDFAIASVHTSFEMSRDEMTRRILISLNHPKVKIFGHPTGRKLNEREGYELDWEQVFDFCLKNQKWLEINSWPDRLDLPDNLVREAVKKGVKMVICTDTHEISHMDLMEYGVAVVRRGWAQKDDIINTLEYNEFKKLLE